MLKTTGKHLLNILMPARCLNCGAFVEDVNTLCMECWNNIEFIGNPCCSICSFPFEYDMGEGAICAACAAKEPKYTRAVSVFRYNRDSRKLVTRFKYSDKIGAAMTFAGWMERAGRSMLADSDIITPVPLHRMRLLTRHYNQAALLANNIGRISGIRVMPDLLLRVKNNIPQAALSQKERLKNVRGAFTLNKRVAEKDLLAGKNIMLVDDVMTTGATIEECSRVLKKAKASKVYVLTLSRTVQND